jgi:hypothetical protein
LSGLIFDRTALAYFPPTPSRRANGIHTTSRRRLSRGVGPSTPKIGAFRRAISKVSRSIVCARFASGAEVSDAIAPLGLDAATHRAVLDRSAALAERWSNLALLELRELVPSVVQQIQNGEAQILKWLNRTAIVPSVMPDAAPNPTDRMTAVETLVLSIAASLRRARKGMRLVIGGAAKVVDGRPRLADRSFSL